MGLLQERHQHNETMNNQNLQSKVKVPPHNTPEIYYLVLETNKCLLVNPEYDQNITM